MRAFIIFALFMMLLGIAGLQNATANCAGEYAGEHHSLYVADIDHPCPNNYTFAEYSLYGSGSGDFDLYVLDTYDDTWYSSEKEGYNEYLNVPIHCGYPHKAYVWTYKGSGRWSLCSPQVYFGSGFEQIADTETAPDTAASTTTTTSGESVNRGLVGRWILTYNWDCDQSSEETDIIFNSDGTFGDDDDPAEGNWTEDGQSLSWEHDEDPHASYRGSISGPYMSGTMSTDDGSSGCWTARKVNEDS